MIKLCLNKKVEEQTSRTGTGKTIQPFKTGSVDNLDRLAPRAAVRAGQKSRVWSGTTIQVVIPKPYSLPINKIES